MTQTTEKENAVSEPPLSTKPWRRRAPRSFHVNKDGSLICRHRDLSVCGACAAEHREILDVHGNHYWMPSEAEYSELATQMQDSEPPTFLVSDNDVMREAKEERLTIASVPPERERAKITERALHLLREIAAGRDRVYASDARPPGMSALMQCGYATRLGTERAAITPTGRAFLAGVDYVAWRP